MTAYLPCGHPLECMYRYRIGKKVYSYCLGCVLDRVGTRITDDDLKNCSQHTKLLDRDEKKEIQTTPLEQKDKKIKVAN